MKQWIKPVKISRVHGYQNDSIFGTDPVITHSRIRSTKMFGTNYTSRIQEGRGRKKEKLFNLSIPFLPQNNC